MCDRLLGPGSLRVHGPNIGEYAYLRQCNVAQEFDLTRHVESHLQYRDFVFSVQTQHRQWQADLVVQIAGVF